MIRPGERTLRLLNAPFAAALAHPDTTEVVVNRPGEFGVEQRGRWTWHDAPELDFARLDAIATLAAAMMKLDVGSDRPLCRSFLPDGERILIARPSATAAGTVSLTIRKPPRSAPSLGMLADGGLFDATEVAHRQAHPLDAELARLHSAKDWLAFFPLAVQARKNIMVCGDTGSGKTTITRSLIQCIPEHERLVTIEDTPEFGQLPHRNVVNLFYPKDDQGPAPLHAGDLMEASLRMRPDRVLMQELSDGAAFIYIRNVVAGHPGSISTCHSTTCDGAFDALRLMVKQHDAGKHMADADIRTLLRQHIDVVIHCAKDPYRITQVYFDPAAKLAAAALPLPSFPALAAE